MSWPRRPLGQTPVHDGLFLDRLADPSQALQDVIEAHRWATRARDQADSVHAEYVLTEERKRLALISWELKHPGVRR